MEIKSTSNECEVEVSENQETNRNDLPFSYHTFIFSFLFECKNHSGRKDFITYIPSIEEGRYEDVFDSKNVNKANYDAYRYFNQAAKNAIYTESFDESAIVWNYRYDIERMANNGNYTGMWCKSSKDSGNLASLVIKKGDFSAKLAVNGVRLKLFNTGVGMLIFELENYQHCSQNTVIKINEFGRRVFMPFITSNDDHTCSLCADDISLFYADKKIENASGAVSGVEINSPDEINLAPIIKFFLSNKTKGITTSPNPKENEVYIEPIIDDRMFVACIYGNKMFVDDMKKWDSEERVYKFLSDAEKYIPTDRNNRARRLYEMMFVDGDGITCLNRIMLKTLLEKHIYSRWLEYGTITGITEYSMITVTSGLNFLALPFLAEYVEMILLVLAQRASLLAFERLISEIACGKIKLDMEKVQTKYIKFQSELLLQEVTGQQQGIETYSMLMDNMFINQQQSGIENKIRALFELNSAANEKNENWILFMLAVLGVSEVVQIINDWIGSIIYEELKISTLVTDWISQHNNLCCFAVSFLFVVVLYKYKKRRKKWI